MSCPFSSLPGMCPYTVLETTSLVNGGTRGGRFGAAAVKNPRIIGLKSMFYTENPP